MLMALPILSELDVQEGGQVHRTDSTKLRAQGRGLEGRERSFRSHDFSPARGRPSVAAGASADMGRGTLTRNCLGGAAMGGEPWVCAPFFDLHTCDPRIRRRVLIN